MLIGWEAEDISRAGCTRPSAKRGVSQGRERKMGGKRELRSQNGMRVGPELMETTSQEVEKKKAPD